MGCGGSRPVEEEQSVEPAPAPEKKVDSEEMAAIRAKLAEAKDKGGFKRDKTFKRKFEGYKVGGGGKHVVHRATNKQETDAINSKIRETAEGKSSKAPTLTNMARSFTRSFTRRSSASGEQPVGLVRTLTRMITRKGRRTSSSKSLAGEDTDYERAHNAHIDAINAKWDEDNTAGTASTPATADAAELDDAPAAAPAAELTKAASSKVMFGVVEDPMEA